MKKIVELFDIYENYDDILNKSVYPIQQYMNHCLQSEKNDFMTLILQVPGKLKIVDFGGRDHVHYHALSHQCKRKIIEYNVIETPEFVKETNNEGRIYDNISQVSGNIDIIYNHASMQYHPNILQLLHSFQQLQPSHILLQAIIIDNQTYLTTQKYDGLLLPYWIIGMNDLTSIFKDYTMSYKKYWRNAEHTFQLQDRELIAYNVLFSK